MRSQRLNEDKRMLLSPKVKSCKLHLLTEKPLAGGASRMVEPPDAGKEKAASISPAVHLPTQRNREQTDGRGPADRTLPGTSIVCHVTRVSPPGLGGFSALSNQQEGSWKRVQSAGTSPSQRDVLYCSRPTVNSGRYVSNKVPGLDRLRFGPAFLRLDLDRRRLGECPQLHMVDRLQLLNLQHNRIASIQHLAHLQSLVLLNLSHNSLCGMAGLEHLRSLRVLLLGRNRIQEMSCLDQLQKLHILDLHDNQICRIQNVSHLSELRVLNLAGNLISSLENLQGLEQLRELHLQHNRLSALPEVDCLPSLQRLFLSCNNISSSWDQVAGLGNLPSLCELALDGNPVALETWYKQAVLRCLLRLQQLDMKRVTDEDRRMAGVQTRKEEEKKRESHKQTIHKEKRRLAIRNAAQLWEGVRACLELPPTNGSKEDPSPESSPAHSPAQTNGLAQDPSPEEPRTSPGSGPERPSVGTEGRLRTSSRPSSPREPKPAETGGSSVQSLSLSDSHLAELDGDTLRLFGLGALEALERGWGAQTAAAVTVISFRYISFDAIVPTLPRIRVKFPNLSHLIFFESSVERLVQLAALAQVRRLEQLTVHPEGNPVVRLALWRSFVIYRLQHFNLQRINGQEVTMNDVIAAERVFGTLGHIAATETPRCRLLLLLEESRKRQLQFLLEGRGRRAGLSPEELRDNGRLLGEGLSRALFNYPSRDGGAGSPEEGSVASSQRCSMVDEYLQDLVRRASDTNLKGEALHKLWPSVFAEIVRDCVLDMGDPAAFRRSSLARLANSK